MSQLALLSDEDRRIDTLARANAQISSSASFAVFFGLGFIGKVVMTELWSHLVKVHNSFSPNPQIGLQRRLKSIRKAFVWAVVATVIFYVICFSILTSRYIHASKECAGQQNEDCVNAAQLQQPCEESKQYKLDLDLSEGAWAAFVLLTFTLLMLYIKGLVFGMYVCAMLPCYLLFLPHA